MKAIFSQGPNITFLNDDMNFLKENGYRDFDFIGINAILRISIVNKKNLQGKMCEPGINVRRYPERISPHDYKGKQYWVIRISRDKFNDFINSETEFDGTRYIISRCKYDRMSIGYFSD